MLKTCLKKGNEIIKYDDYAVIIINSKKFGIKEVLIDFEDIEKVKSFTWCFTHSRDENLYAMTKDKSKTIKLHRFLMDCPKGYDIDHINHDTLDNRKSNLKICTRTVNNHNLGVRTDTYTGFKYITRKKYNDNHSKDYEIYIIQIKRNGVNFRKSSANLIHALKIRDEFLIKNQERLNINEQILNKLLQQKI